MKEFPYKFDKDGLHAIDAMDHAQFIVFAPYIYETYRILKDKNILKFIENSDKKGMTIPELAEKSNMSIYAIRVLLEAGLGIKLVHRKEDSYFLSKTGHMLLNDKTTMINDEFMRDFCEVGAKDLYPSLIQSKPIGLSHYGDWDTVYDGLSKLPKEAQNSWFSFDHYYSDSTFPEALKWLFTNPPKSMIDIGCNTGRWTLQCLNHDENIKMGMVDLPGQINMARKNIEEQGFSDRVEYYPGNILDEEFELPKGYEMLWMSQFLDCFADEQILSILQKCHRACTKDTRVIINEIFWDRQRFKTSAFILQMTSLYFTTMANGYSQMYDSKVFDKLIDKAGFEIVNRIDEVGLNSHTMTELRIK